MQAYSSLYNQTLNGTPALLPHSSLCHSTLPAHHAGGEALHRACTRAALPQGSGELGIFLIQPAQEPTEPLGWQGQGTTWPCSNHKSFLLAKGNSLEQRKHLQLWSVFGPLCKGRADPSWISTAASSSSLRSAFPREGNSPRALGSVSETSC